MAAWMPATRSRSSGGTLLCRIPPETAHPGGYCIARVKQITNAPLQEKLAHWSGPQAQPIIAHGTHGAKLRALTDPVTTVLRSASIRNAVMTASAGRR